MKKQNLLPLLLFVIAVFNHAGAATVTATSAQTVASNFFKSIAPGSGTFSANLAYTKTESDGTTDYYIFNMSPVNGFVIVAGDDRSKPILAYSTEGPFVVDTRGATGVSDWMKSAAVKVHYIVTNNLTADAATPHLWNSYAQGTVTTSTRSTTLGPMLSTTWNQNPYYNALCPPAALPSTSNSKAVTGCVATAMAQIMKYWNYPSAGTGGTLSYTDAPPTYSVNYGTLSTNVNRPLYWSAMPNNVNTNNSPVDSLMYELGVAVHMDYDSTGSGAYVLTTEVGPGQPCSQTVYATNFYYNPNTLQGVALANYSDASWITLMESELLAGRVVQYEGDDPTQGGHTWVMDGYQTQATGLDYLHMNWGWGGFSDGFFSVTNLLTQNGGFNPSQNDAALIGIEPMFPFQPSISPSSATVCQGAGGTQLTVTGPAGATYSWTPTADLSCTTCPNPTASPNSTTTYTCRVDSAGVIVPVTVTVTVATGVVPAFSTPSATTSCSIPLTVTFSNSSQFATSYLWEFGDGSTDTTANPSHTYNTYGNFTVVLTAIGNCGTDSLTQANYINVTDNTPAVTPASICPGQTATLAATTGSNITWYNSASGGTPISTGASYTTPSLSTTTTYYVQASTPGPLDSVGAVTNAIGAGSVFTGNTVHGLIFNNSQAQTLTSVDVYASTSGNRTFTLMDSFGGTAIGTPVTVNVTGTGNNPTATTVPLNIALPAGNNLFLQVSSATGGLNLYRNRANGSNFYPFTSNDGTVVITGNDVGNAGYYYYMYNWQLQGPSCTSSLEPVQVSVLTGSGGSFSYTNNATTVNFTPVTTATSYTWNFGDGSPTSTSSNPQHTYASPGTYTVTEVVSNGGCQETIIQTVSVYPAGIEAVNGMDNMTVYPNPVQDQLSIRITSPQSNNCQMSIYNVLGEVVAAKALDLSSGNVFTQDVSALSPGLYIISLQDAQSKATRSFVKQ